MGTDRHRMTQRRTKKPEPRLIIVQDEQTITKPKWGGVEKKKKKREKKS